MTAPQIIYLIAVTIYLIFFGLFLRFFFWKAYADVNYWRRKPYLDIDILQALAKKKNRPLPYVSVLVPARNEADVIEKTIDHMLSLNYPGDRYELLIATDEKELKARDEKLPDWVLQARQFVGGQVAYGRLSPQSRALVLGVLSRLCLDLCRSGALAGSRLFSTEYLPRSGSMKHLDIVREMAETVVLSGERLPVTWTQQLVQRVFPDFPDQQIRSISALYLSLALCVALAYWSCLGPEITRERRHMLSRYWKLLRDGTADAQKIAHKGSMLAGKILGQAAALEEAGGLEREIHAIARQCVPTTQDIVDKKMAESVARQRTPVLKHIVVPYDFDGKIDGKLTGRSVPSTKGRALNYALSFVNDNSEMCGFYDAESRPDPDVLMYVAFRRLGDGNKVRILQGPVFQVRNFYQMGPFCKIASLYQAIAHDWYMPALFKRLPFVGGTNLFAERSLLREIGGYDHSSLTEDLELGARAYLLSGAWPEYLPYYSSEQTPPTFHAFFRQRLRWGTGHLQVMDKIRAEDRYPAERKKPLLRQLFIKGQVEWVIYQGATFVPPIVLTLWYNGLVDPYVLPEAVRWVLNGFSATYVAFTIYAYYRYYPYVDSWARPKSLAGKIMVVMQLFFLPMAAFFFPVPYSSAMVLKALNRHPKTWTKTPRTRE